MSKVIKQPTAPFNPFYGCVIMLIVLFMGIGGIAWIIHSGRTINAAIARFAVDHPVELHPQKPDDAGVAALKTRLEAFAATVKEGKPAKLELSIPELNAITAMAPDTGYGSFATMIAFSGVKDNRLLADVCWTLNKSPFEQGVRYAAGQAEFEVTIVKDSGPDLKLVAFVVPGKEVVPQFVQSFAGLALLSPYHKLPALTPVMKAIKSAKVTATGVTLSTEP